MSEITFARVLAAAREAHGLNQSELANLSGIDPSLISRLERGARVPSTDVLERLSHTLGVNLTSQETISAVKVLSGGGIAPKAFQG